MSGKKRKLHELNSPNLERWTRSETCLRAAPNSSRGCRGLGFDGLQWEELEVILLVKPSALEHFHSQPGPRGERQGIHHQLVYGVDLTSLRLVGAQSCHLEVLAPTAANR